MSVFQNGGFSGRSARFDDVRDLRQQGWNDRISSIRVDRGRFGDRGRDENRSRYSDRPVPRERACEIVRRAYRAVLNREPDAGAEGFVTHVMREGWTEQDVERELRRSPEYRQARPR